MTDQVRIEAEGAIGRITIDRPAVLNAIDTPARDAIRTAVSALDRDARIRVIVLTGSGDRSFCSGADLHETANVEENTARAILLADHAMLEAIRLTVKPVVARVNGYALGTGLLLVLVADIVVAADHAQFGLPEVRGGAAAALQAAYLPQVVGLARAKAMALLGGPVSAREAQDMGLVHQVVARSSLDDAVAQTAARLCALEPAAIALQKDVIRAWAAGADHPASMYLDAVAQLLADRKTRHRKEEL